MVSLPQSKETDILSQKIESIFFAVHKKHTSPSKLDTALVWHSIKSYFAQMKPGNKQVLLL